MVDIPMRSSGAMDKQSILSINQIKVQGAKDRHSIQDLNKKVNQGGTQSQQSAGSRSVGASSTTAPAAMTTNQATNATSVQMPTTVQKRPIPQLNRIIRKGQKVPLENAGKLNKIEACLGWNIKNPACDVDVSAFLLSANKVISDDWFVFYGHPKSPDNSTVISSDNGTDRQIVSIDFSKIDGRVEKIVFVLTINEALEKRLNFSMIQDAYVRVLESGTKTELVSFLMDEYYDNVTSMMIGEVYKHNGAWKFNAIGNGVARDLAGLCELYGVQVD